MEFKHRTFPQKEERDQVELAELCSAERERERERRRGQAGRRGHVPRVLGSKRALLLVCAFIFLGGGGE